MHFAYSRDGSPGGDVFQYVEIGAHMKMLAMIMETEKVTTRKMRNLVILPNQSRVSKTRRYRVRIESFERLIVSL